MTIKKKFIIAGMTVVVLAIVGIAIGVNNHRNAVAAQKRADEKARVVRLERSISRKTTAIRNEESHDKALDDLKNLEFDYRNYKKAAKPEAKVLALYKSDIAKMKDTFKSKDVKKLNAVTLDDKALAKTAKKDIKNNVKVLSNLSDTVKGEENIVYGPKETKTLITKINKLTDSYNAQIKKIDDATKRAKEEAVKKNAEAATRTVTVNAAVSSSNGATLSRNSGTSSASRSNGTSTARKTSGSTSTNATRSTGTSSVTRSIGCPSSSSARTNDSESNSSKGNTQYNRTYTKNSDGSETTISKWVSHDGDADDMIGTN